MNTIECSFHRHKVWDFEKVAKCIGKPLDEERKMAIKVWHKFSRSELYQCVSPEDNFSTEIIIMLHMITAKVKKSERVRVL